MRRRRSPTLVRETRRCRTTCGTRSRRPTTSCRSRLGVACAVRSSAISEDGSAASFAGLYETYLNMVGGVDERAGRRAPLLRLAVVASAPSATAPTRGGDADEAMAVVVMGLVPSETSGIAFTAHPVTGSLDQVVINASWGLGEAIVSGRVTPDSFVDRQAQLRHAGARNLRRRSWRSSLIRTGGGGTVEEKLSPDRQRAASLTDEQACDVARLAAKVEDALRLAPGHRVGALPAASSICCSRGRLRRSG